jgi:hypothetical protein
VAALLDYSSQRKRSWLSRWRWRFVTLAAFVAIAVPIVRNRDALILRGNWLYWSHECAVHRMPGPIELVITDPAKAQKVLAADPDFVPINNGQGALYAPRALRNLIRYDVRWLAVLANRRGDEAIAFLGSRRRPDGAWRTVIVQGSVTNAHDMLWFTNVLVLPQPSVFDPIPTLGHGPTYDKYYGRRPFIPAALRGGVVDPADPSHIVFQFDIYDLSGPSQNSTPPVEATGVIDAYLQNDDSLRFVLRETPELAKLDVNLHRTNIDGAVSPKAIVPRKPNQQN